MKYFILVLKNIIASISHCNRIHIGDKVICLEQVWYVKDIITRKNGEFDYALESEEEYYITSLKREIKRTCNVSRSLFKRKLCLHNILNALFYEYKAWVAESNNTLQKKL